MALFKSDILTATRVEICGDRWRPDMGTLRPRSGSTQHTLVHGDDYEEIEGNQYSHVQQNRTLKTTGNYSCSVQGDRCMDETNRTHQTRGNFTSNVTGTTTLNRVGATTENYTQPLTENHSAPRHTNEPIQWFETKGFQGSLIGMSVDVINAAFSLKNLDVFVFNHVVNLGVLECAAKIASIDAVAANIEMDAMDTKARAVEAKAGAVDVDSALDVSSAHLSSNSRVM